MKNPVLRRDVSNARHNLSDSNLQEQILTLDQNNINENKSIEQVLALKFKKEGFESLTVIQEKALPVIARKINCLLVAPTGSGKTEAAVLPVFSMVSTSTRSSGNVRVVYITPLRALNNDVFRRIIKYAESEGLRVEIRHSDSTLTTRRRIIESPPDILITTPE
ncbi:MAG TPA: DEAD/DEAH box helicase, partial [Candidatus Nitrosopolaris sp.]|nr:DEAD/DEAH box helicase [Candidatus Nitrosopolaris sp.]